MSNNLLGFKKFIKNINKLKNGMKCKKKLQFMNTCIFIRSYIVHCIAYICTLYGVHTYIVLCTIHIHYTRTHVQCTSYIVCSTMYLCMYTHTSKPCIDMSIHVFNQYFIKRLYSRFHLLETHNFPFNNPTFLSTIQLSFQQSNFPFNNPTFLLITQLSF